jgi:hypothetical protein
MAKRARGARRPGQRRSIQRTGPRTAPRQAAAPEPSAAPALATDAATTAPVDEVAPRTGPGLRARARGGPSASFAESAAQEYAYVASDVRRIALVGGSLFATLIVLFVLIEVAGVIRP